MESIYTMCLTRVRLRLHPALLYPYSCHDEFLLYSLNVFLLILTNINNFNISKRCNVGSILNLHVRPCCVSVDSSRYDFDMKTFKFQGEAAAEVSSSATKQAAVENTNGSSAGESFWVEMFFCSDRCVLVRVKAGEK